MQNTEQKTGSETQQGDLSKLQEEYKGVVSKYLPGHLRNSPSKVKVIEVGCGFGIATKAFVGAIGSNIDYLGIDNGGVVMGARLRNQDVKGARFEIADARTAASLGTNNNLAILRNPQVFGEEITPRIIVNGVKQPRKVTGDWRMIVENTFNSLAPGGTLFLTTTEKEEISAVLGILSQGSYEVLMPPQPISPPLQAKFPIKEEYIATLRKK